MASRGRGFHTALGLAFFAALAIVLAGPVLAMAPLAGDSCCDADAHDESAPCSGATDDCACPCCPLPVLGSEVQPLDEPSVSLSAVSDRVASPISAVGPSPDHPPE
jgi:hypothetical protein